MEVSQLYISSPLPNFVNKTSFMDKSPGGFAVTSILQTGVPNPPVVPSEVVVSSSSYIPGTHNIGADFLSRQGLRPGEWSLHPEVVELL